MDVPTMGVFGKHTYNSDFENRRYRKYLLTFNPASFEANEFWLKTSLREYEYRNYLNFPECFGRSHECAHPDDEPDGKRPGEDCDHYHLYIHFANPVAWGMIKEVFPGAHIDTARGSDEQNKDYIYKQGKHLGKAWTSIDAEWVGECRPHEMSRTELLADFKDFVASDEDGKRWYERAKTPDGQKRDVGSALISLYGERTNNLIVFFYFDYILKFIASE